MSSQSDRLATLVDASRAAEAAGDWDNALARLEEALACAREDGNGKGAAAVLRSTARVHFDRGNLDAAGECYEAALALARSHDLKRDVASALNGLAVVAQFRGQLQTAEKLFEEAGKQAEALGEEQLAAMVNQNIGILANMRGAPAIALVRYAAAAERLRRLGDDRARAFVLNNMGITHTGLGEWAAAELCFASAYELADRLRDLRTLSRIEINRAEMYLKRHDFGSARVSADKAFHISGRIGSDAGLGAAYKTYGIIYRETGRPRVAEIQLGLALQLARVCELRLLEGEVHDETAQLYVMQGRSREALRALNAAHQIFAALEARRELLDVERRIERLEETYLRAISLLESQTSAGNDPFAAGRYERVAAITCKVAEAMGFRGRDLSWMRIASFVYDVGRSTVPHSILNKPGALTADEWDLMKQHPLAGDEIVTDLGFPEEIRPVVLHHHEHWDGGGYPNGLKGEEIPLLARILALGDVYDALTSDRPYRPAFAPDDALTIMHAEAGRKLDPELFRIFRGVVGAGVGTASGAAASRSAAA
jgi:response regulator RpfG family c-di-GMP phosphodiesterase